MKIYKLRDIALIVPYLYLEAGNKLRSCYGMVPARINPMAVVLLIIRRNGGYVEEVNIHYSMLNCFVSLLVLNFNGSVKSVDDPHDAPA